MTAAVPRKADSHVSGLERARGRDSASAREKSARADGLEEARSIALRAIATPDGLADWCTLAAGNVDLSAKVLLELLGQGARGPCRTRAWILRNGARIRKGERGYAVSMFGAYVWRLEQSTGRFGGFGLSAEGSVPADELAGWTGICGGDDVAAAIVAAMRGYRLESVTAPVVDLASLDRSLAIVRGIAWNLPACLSCDGAGCVLCSCADDRCRQPQVYCEPMATKRVESVARPAPKRIGRPPKVRPELPDVAAAMREVRRLRDEADRVSGELRAEAASIEYQALKQAWANHSLADIAATAGVTRARIHQIVKSH